MKSYKNMLVSYKRWSQRQPDSGHSALVVWRKGTEELQVEQGDGVSGNEQLVVLGLEVCRKLMRLEFDEIMSLEI